jgi:hypothetical protein
MARAQEYLLIRKGRRKEIPAFPSSASALPPGDLKHLSNSLARYRLTAGWLLSWFPTSIRELGIVEEEADETLFWLELLNEMKITDNSSVDALMKEGNEIISMIVSSIKTCKAKK